MDSLWTVLPALALLACPLMMVLCFVGMRRMGHEAPSPDVTAGVTEPRETRIARLEQQLLAVHDELAALRDAPTDAPHRVNPTPSASERRAALPAA